MLCVSGVARRFGSAQARYHTNVGSRYGIYADAATLGTIPSPLESRLLQMLNRNITHVITLLIQWLMLGKNTVI